MSKRVHRPAMHQPFEAKHVIVAGCAAIAMVLGAMSTGVSISPHNDPAPTQAQVSSIVKAVVPGAATPSVSVTNLTKQNTLQIRRFFEQKSAPLYTTPNQNQALKTILPSIFSVTTPPLIDKVPLFSPLPAKPASSSDTSSSQTATPPDSASQSTSTSTTPSDTSSSSASTTTPSNTTTAPPSDSSSSQATPPPADSTPPAPNTVAQ